MNVEIALTEYRQALNNELCEIARRFLSGPPELDLMLRYHLGWVDNYGKAIEGVTGKQIRPTLVLISTAAAGGDWRQALPAAAAIELIHNFSLIHDDIQDNSPLRRGRPTLWKIWGVEKAINAGDAMFALAHMALWRLIEVGVSASRVVDVLALFEAANLTLTYGQHMDMTFEHQGKVLVADYIEMIGGKSAALLATSMQLGAVIAGLSSEQAQHYADFGYNLGLAFQIRDDILGIWGNPDVTGKSTATDIVSRKKSLPILYGLEHSIEFSEHYSVPYVPGEDVDMLVELLGSVGALEFATQEEQKYFDRAQGAYESMEIDSSAGAILGFVVDSLVGRVL